MTFRGDDLRLHELLAGRALGDLSPREARELDAALAARADRACLERTATHYARLAERLRRDEPMPASLAARLSSLAHAFEAGRL